MKSTLLLVAIALMVSCTSTMSPEINPDEGACSLNEQIVAPIGVQVSALGELEAEGWTQSFEFLDENTWFELAWREDPGVIEFRKTSNQGSDWEVLPLETVHIPIDVLFLDESIGLITLNDVSGCPEACGQRSLLLKTEDGGEHWREIVIEDSFGTLNDLQVNQSGRITALCDSEGELRLLSSLDQGESWQIVYSQEISMNDLVQMTHVSKVDEVYLPYSTRGLLRLSTEGQVLERIDVGSPFINAIAVINEDNLVVETISRTLVSNDAGQTWTEVADEVAKVVGFNSSSQGLIIEKVKDCPQLGTSNDVLSYTTDGAISWERAKMETTQFMETFRGSQQIDETTWFMVIGNVVYRLDI